VESLQRLVKFAERKRLIPVTPQRPYPLLLLVGDAVVGDPPGRCKLLPEKVVDDPARLRESVPGLLVLDFETLLVGDREPIPQFAKERLRETGKYFSQVSLLSLFKRFELLERFERLEHYPRLNSRLTNRMSPLVGVDDLTARGKPNAVMFFDVGDGALQIFNAQRLADDHRM
jgi:hypothetical protein